MLGFYPDGMKNTTDIAPPFNSWITTGGVNVRKITGGQIVIECAPNEIAAVFLRDVERLLNHCLEHALEIHRFTIDDRMRSDAWNVVTIYYQCFFTAQALLRLIGEPVLFLSKDIITAFKTASGSTASVGPGVYEFRQTGSPTITTSEYTLDKKARRPHEATWKRVFHLFDNLVKDRALATDAAEVAIFACLATQRLFKVYADYDWPSAVRHSANYTPGFAYLLVEKLNRTKTKGLFNRWKGLEEHNIESFLRYSIDHCICSNAPESFETHVQLLYDIGQMLFVLTRRLYNDLIVRRACDKRWSLRRNSLIERAGISVADYPLLFKSS